MEENKLDILEDLQRLERVKPAEDLWYSLEKRLYQESSVVPMRWLVLSGAAACLLISLNLAVASSAPTENRSENRTEGYFPSYSNQLYYD